MQEGEPDRHYVFWLGAGCSVTSGIPAASALVQDDWLPRLHRLKTGGDDLAAWVADAFPDYQPERAGSFYGPVMDELFVLPEDRQRETERLCSDHEPGFGYAVLAALMSRDDGVLSATLTTNFDDMIADAMYVYGARRPLVIQHDALARFARPGRVRRPLVVKVHGDHRLNPMHTVGETAKLQEEVATGVRGLLQDRGVIFAGYSGNDRGVIDTLTQLPSGALPLGVWWVSRDEPTGAIRPWLESRNAIWVQSGTFDELMLLFHKEFELKHPTGAKFAQMIEVYQRTYESLNAHVERLPDSDRDSAALKTAAERAVSTATDWWGVELEARRHRTDNPQLAQQIYERGIAGFADARLFNNYALFLQSRDVDRAEEIFRQGIELGGRNARLLANYAIFLHWVRSDVAQSIEHFERALEVDPECYGALSMYPALLLDIGGDLALARSLHKRLEALEPNSVDNQINYIRLLFCLREDEEALELAGRLLPTEAEIEIELSLYLLAAGPAANRPLAVARLRHLIAQGTRSERWHFGPILDRARADAHPDIEWLERLAAVIADGADPGPLDDWDAWASASSDAGDDA